MCAWITRFGAGIAASCLAVSIAKAQGEPGDFGDAPDSYHTLLASNGPLHHVTPPILGQSSDSDADGQPSPNADGDDLDGFDDEDGVLFRSPLLPGADVLLNVWVVQFSVTKMNAWVDFAGNGTFVDPEDHIYTDQVMGPGRNELHFAVPANAKVGPTYARFRVSHEGGDSFDGPGGGGEVEDYAVAIEAPVAREPTSWGRMKATYRSDG